MSSNDTRLELEEAIIDYGFIKFAIGSASVQVDVAEDDDAWDVVLCAIANHEAQCEKEAFDQGFVRGIGHNARMEAKEDRGAELRKAELWAEPGLGAVAIGRSER